MTLKARFKRNKSNDHNNDDDVDDSRMESEHDYGDEESEGTDSNPKHVLPKNYFRLVNPLITAVIVIGLFVMVQVSGL